MRPETATSVDGWSVRVADVDCAPGRAIVRVPVFTDLDGSLISVIVQAIVGTTPGRILAVIAGIHGSEWQSSAIASVVAQSVEPTRMAGALLVVPVANPVALVSRSFTVRDESGVDDMAGAFGRSGAWIPEQLASAISEHVLKRADAAIDLRAGLWGVARRLLTVEHSLRDSSPTADALPLARAFGAPLRVSEPSAERSRSAAASYEIPSFVAAIGGVGFAAELEEGWLAENVDGVHNVLRHLRVLSEGTDREAPRMFGESHRVSPRNAGILDPVFTVEDLMRRDVGEGDLLARIWSPYTFELIEELRAPRAGLVAMASGVRPVRPGDHAYEIVVPLSEADLG